MKKSLWYLYAIQIIFLLPSIAYWLDRMGWSLSGLTALNFFPVLGLSAFTMMWLHLMVAALRKVKPDLFDYGTYYKKTSNIVLALILLHPALLIFGSFDAGNNFIDYAGDKGRIFIVFGSISLLLFLAYEVINRLRDRAFIKNNSQYVTAMNRIGFILVYVHGLQLGQHLQSGWLRILWLFYGLTTAAYYIWAYYREIKIDKSTNAIK